MTPKAVLDEIISDYDGVTADDADNAPRRAKLLRFLQHINNYVHNFRPWRWTWKELAFTIAAGQNSVSLATAIPDYLEFGRSGSLFDTDRRLRMRETSLYLFQRIRREYSGATGIVPKFAVFDGKIQVPYTVSSLTNFLAFYRRVAETLADPGVEMLIPDTYVRTVIIPGVVYRAQQGKQDARPDWGSQFKEGLVQMCAIENPLKTSARRLPLAVPGAW